MSFHVKGSAATVVFLLFFLYPIINWFQYSEIITVKPVPTRPRPITQRHYSHVKPPTIQSRAPAPPEALADWSGSQTLITMREQRCLPKMNVVYLKTHKTASSTLQNIVCRWGERNNLTFALPTTRVHIEYPMTREGLVKSPSGTYNILANHARFEPKAFNDIMSPDSVYITILRHPHQQYESYYNYFHCQAPRVYGASLHKFLEDPQRYLDYARNRNVNNPQCVDAIRNPQLYDLGFNSVRRGEKSPARSATVDEWIVVLNKSFDLVLIADYFTESLVALKHTMCWETEDVVVFDVNRRLPSATPSETHQIEYLPKLIESWNAGDVKLYQHFNRTLWRRLDLIGRSAVAREIAAIQKRTHELVDRCLDNIEWISDTEYRTKTAYQTPLKNIVASYTLKSGMRNDPLCQRLALTAPNYLDFLRRKMKREV
ncbi:galactosylceramide sulfotransferase-like [Patiria miniata]|uniref:Galactose-3-O-sulfotransferase 2-like n=1 Tax=Patiria miniata TaxID=46514 RepID=A0A914AM78_PATMI|nr:galactosylceramide sulfotransferase-like [Patiria miniata]